MKQRLRTIGWETFQFDFKGNVVPREESEEEFDTSDEDIFSDEKEKDVAMMTTPWGPWAIDDTMNPFKRFEFWIGHTNFVITKQVAHKLKRTLGVEVLRILSPYRFIVGIGKMFVWADVRVEIERRLCGKHRVAAIIDEIENVEVNKQVTNLKSEISKDNQFWAIYIFPNGNIEHVKSNRMDGKFNTGFSLLKDARDMSGGVLISYEDEYD